MSSSTPSSVETLLNSLSDVSFVLNESMSVQSMSEGSGVLRNLPRNDMIGRPWLDLVRESDKAIVSEALQTALETPEQAHRADLGLLVGSEAEPVPVTCWLCASSDGASIRIACVDLRGETNLRQQLVNAQRTLEQDYWSNRRLEARYRRTVSYTHLRAHET